MRSGGAGPPSGPPPHARPLPGAPGGNRMRPQQSRAQSRVVAHALRPSWHLLLLAGLVSGAVNVLALTGSVYTLEIYNSVLPHRSAAVLAALTLAMLGLYSLSGALDFLRARLLCRAAMRVDRDLSERVFALQQVLALTARPRGDGLQPMRDLEQIRTFLASAGPTALFDMPWIPIYLGAIVFLHPLLGLLAGAGAFALIGLVLLAEAIGAEPVRTAAHSAARRWAFAAAAQRNAEAVRAMGLKPHLGKRWSALTARHLEAQRGASRLANGVGAAIKVARPSLQSGVLGLGACLALAGEASPGTMIAASIIVARALAPVETAIAHWRALIAARQSFARLTALFAANPEDAGARPRLVPPIARPQRSLSVENLSVAPPGGSSPVVYNVGFALEAGAGLGIIGPSASGKSTLARALVGVWLPAPESGSVRIDGVALAHWDADTLGRHVGYLPQGIELFAGSIADNIARFDPDAGEDTIIAAARAAGAHAMIEDLTDGYRTEIGEAGMMLSAGQRQRIGLARALFGEPFLVVLDEPNANLDASGENDLVHAIAAVRARGGIVVVIAHRRSALSAVDQVLALAGGRVAALGPRDQVLASVLMPSRPAQVHVRSKASVR